MSRWRDRPREPMRPYEPGPWDDTYHSYGWPVPWLRVHRDGQDVTTEPVESWPRYDREAYAAGWRPDRWGDPPETVPDAER